MLDGEQFYASQMMGQVRVLRLFHCTGYFSVDKIFPRPLLYFYDQYFNCIVLEKSQQKKVHYFLDVFKIMQQMEHPPILYWLSILVTWHLKSGSLMLDNLTGRVMFSLRSCSCSTICKDGLNQGSLLCHALMFLWSVF